MSVAFHAISVDGLEKSFGDFHALSGADFHVDPGEVFGFLGPNGAGKTTTISILAGLLRPDAGTARIAGVEAGTPAARARLGVVPQEIALYDDLPARENLAFFGGLQGLASRDLVKRIDVVLAHMGLTDRASDRVGTFSGGMKRRLNMAASLLHDPEILLLDEPTVGVDPQSRTHIFSTIEALASEGKAVLYTTHYMEEVERLCKRIAILDHGRILAQGTLAELLASMEAKPRHRFRVQAVESARVEQVLGEKPVRVHEDGSEDEAVLEFGAAQAALHDSLGRLEREGVTVLSAEKVRPNLEWLFLELTGRALRD